LDEKIIYQIIENTYKTIEQPWKIIDAAVVK